MSLDQSFSEAFASGNDRHSFPSRFSRLGRILIRHVLQIFHSGRVICPLCYQPLKSNWHLEISLTGILMYKTIPAYILRTKKKSCPYYLLFFRTLCWVVLMEAFIYQQHDTNATCLQNLPPYPFNFLLLSNAEV